ncbi:MAG: glycosyltransferase family 39 protein, partial [Bacillota bacterium]
MQKRASALWVALFFAVLTAAGLLTSADYGQPLDGPSEQVILQENLKEYAVLLLGADSAQVKSYDELGIDRITGSIEMDHGQAAYYPAAPLLKIRGNNPQLFNTLWHMYTWLWFMAGVFSVYCICRSLGLSQVLACAAALLFFLSPRFFAEGHYNNKDVVLLSLTLWTTAAGIRFFGRPNIRRALFFGLAGALAANTRIIGFFVFGVMGITALITLAVRREITRQVIWSGVAAILSFLAVYILVTPAFLFNPAGFISHLLHNAAAFTRWTGVVIFKGAVYDPTGGLPLPRSYLPTMIALTVPVAVLAFT